MDPMFYDYDSSIHSEPELRITVIDDDNKIGVICDRSDDASPLLSPESPPYNIIMPCIHSTNITNDGEILLLPLFRSVYRGEQSDEVKCMLYDD